MNFQMKYSEFWRLYLSAHSKALTRLIHYFATLFGASGLVISIITGDWYWLPITIAGGYIIAPMAHWVVEGNQPLIKVNAFYGAVSDLRMMFLAMIGQLDKEYRKLGLVNKGWGS
ncbi:MAG TPA: DUF962 domain-containing protein [Alphaproteobacteria bacterium]|jgi:hypothetical protein|nr:DUF962 domain-containing protein [Alphaproteobacteria bacterium]HMS44593.1 DUF962 domain-containing protein [Alphaproteobacteria bacterium]